MPATPLTEKEIQQTARALKGVERRCFLNIASTIERRRKMLSEMPREIQGQFEGLVGVSRSELSEENLAYTHRETRDGARRGRPAAVDQLCRRGLLAESQGVFDLTIKGRAVALEAK